MKMKRLLSFALSLVLVLGSASALPSGVFDESTSITASAEVETNGQNYSDFEFKDNGDGTATLVKYVGRGGNISIPAVTSDGKNVTIIGKQSFDQSWDATDVVHFIKSVTIPSSVTSIEDRAFRNTHISSITIPENVTSIGDEAFYGCGYLKDATILGSVENFGDRVFSSTGLSKVTFGEKVKCIGKEAFSRTSLESVTIPGNIKTIGEKAFYSPNGILKNVTIEEGVEIIGDEAFDSCDISDIMIPEGVISIGDSAFCDCKSLETVSIPKSVNHIGSHAFVGTPWLKEQLDGQFFVVVNGILIAANGDECTGDIKIPDGIIAISGKAFESCWWMTSVKIPSSVTIIGESAFDGCGSLTRVTIPSGVTSIGDSAFCCTNLTSVTIPNSVKTIGERAFAGTGLTSITIPKSVENIGQRAFGYTEEDVRISDFKIYAYKGTAGEKYAQKFQLSVNYITDDPTRLAGSGRYETAVEISKAGFPDGSDTVILAYGLNYADALAGVSLAKAKNAPILLTNLKTLPAETLAEIKRLKAKNVIILGGTGAVGKEVETALNKEGLKTERIAGATRFETATKIAQKMQVLNDNKAPEDIFFVYAFNSADALSVSAVAAVKGAPVIYLKTTGDLDDATAAYLKSIKGSVKNAYVIGGEGVISKDMMKKTRNALGVTPVRVFGANRFETCVAVNERFADVLDGDMLCIATGMDFPDALAGGVYAALNKAPLFLINGKAKTPQLSDEQKAYLKTKGASSITAFGGTGVVPDNHIADIAKNSV